jgi:hypothetical protein
MILAIRVAEILREFSNKRIGKKPHGKGGGHRMTFH